MKQKTKRQKEDRSYALKKQLIDKFQQIKSEFEKLDPIEKVRVYISQCSPKIK